jgi:hypothetical protein
MRHLRHLCLPLFVLAACSEDSRGLKLGTDSQVFVTPGAISFPDVPRGEVARLNVEVRHIGTAGQIDLRPIRLETDSLDLSIGLVEKESIGPGEVSRIQIVYASNHDEPDLGTLVIGHNLKDNPETRVPVTTPGQRARLFASPQLLDFGIVQAAAPRTLDVRIINGGTAPATLTGISVDGDDRGDFSADIPPNTVVPVDGEVVIQMTYAPTGRNKDEVVITVETERDDVSVEVPAYGEEETPVLTVTPSLVQLGWTRPLERAAREILIKNEGNTDLDVSAVTLVDARPELALTSRPTGPFTLRPGQTYTMGVVFSPVEAVPMTAEPLGRIRFESSDAARNPLLVPVYGAAGDPSIVVVPESVVDFAFVAEGFTGKRTVTVLNEGTSAVTVTGARLVEPSTDEFAFVNAADLPKVINPGEVVELDLTFENRRGSSGSAFAKFFINTTDPVVPEYPLDVVAQRAQRPTCEAAFVPDLLAIGAHRPGEKARGTLTVMNTGSGNCEYREREFDACIADPFGISFQYLCDDQIAFNPFKLVSEPAPSTILGPGETLAFEFEFDAPDVQSDLGRDSYYARLVALLFDPNSSSLEFVTPPGGVGLGVNVRAETAVPLVAIDPPSIEFGTVRTDCTSDTSQVRIRANGPMDATVSRVEAIGCDGAVRVEGPATPATVPGFGAIYYDLVFAPDEALPTTCVLFIENDSANLPSYEVALAGGGTDKTRQTDAFVQLPAPRVDVLFVIDDSFSMGDDQERLRQELPKVVEIATTWGQDYHLGITTTDTLQVRGNFQGVPRFADPTTPISTFSENMLVGTAGYYIEQGLEAAYLALYNRNARTDIPCQVAVPGQCPRDDGEGVALICVEGFCSGRNYGFLRDDAELAVIIVSDEEDSSPQTVNWYVNRFADLKRPNSGVGVTVHSVIVPAAGCLGGFGTPGTRYVQTSEALNGAIISICAPDFSAEFERVARRTFGLKDRFYLTLPPEPESIAVKVRGAVCTTGWNFNIATGAVVFDEDASCFPQFDDEVEIAYDVYCAARDAQ